MRKHQEDDLRRASQALKPMAVTVLLYVAVIDGGHVKFEPVT